MFVVEAMLHCVTFRLSSHDVSSPVFSVSRPRTINARNKTGKAGLEPRLVVQNYMHTCTLYMYTCTCACACVYVYNACI